MKKIFFVLLFLIVLGMCVPYGYQYFSKNYGDIRPAILPASKNLAERLKNASDSGNFSENLKAVDMPINLPEGFTIGVFQTDLEGARDLQFSPGGTLLLSQPKLGRVVALPDKNHDGQADEIKVVAQGLDKPHGLAFFDKKLYIAEEKNLARYVMNEHTFDAIKNKDILALPTGGRHKTRSVVFDSKGKMYISLGSRCDTCFEDNDWIASVIVTDKEGSEPRIYSRGLRNAVFMTIQPQTDKIWVTEMGRDFLGDNLPPDEINILTDKGDYGWPICYGNKIHDNKFDPPGTYKSRCPDTIQPLYELPAHSAPLGLTFVNSDKFPADYQGDLLVSYHGSWNRSVPTGYKIVRLHVSDNKIVKAEDFITGFLENSAAVGRPVDLEFGPDGNLYISDDKAGAVYVLHYKTSK